MSVTPHQRDELRARQSYIASINDKEIHHSGAACFKCRHWRPVRVPSRYDHAWTGRCGANPPQSLGGDFIPFPETVATLWCGQFEPSSEDAGRCGECRFWNRTGNGNKPGMGQCRVFAPIVSTSITHGGIKFPHTDHREGCAAFSCTEAEDIF